MKKPLAEAAGLFRQLAERDDARDEPEFYRALSLLAEGLHRLEQRLDKLESESAARPPSRPVRLVPRRIITTTA